MSDLFEAYMDDAYLAVEDATPDILPSRAELIQRLESMDFAGEGGAPVAQAVVDEAVVIANALSGAEALVDRMVSFPSGVSRPHGRGIETGWHVATLEEAPVYSGGKVRREADANVLLTPGGTLYVYEVPEWPEHGGMVKGRVMQRYSPACSTRINDRSILFGFATLVAKHDIDPFPQPDNI